MTRLLTIMCIMFTTYAMGQQLTYTPINPSFGGNTFNYQWMLQSAEAQNKLTDPNAVARTSETELDEFNQSINRQLLSQLTRSLLQQGLDFNNLEAGTFNFGTLELEIFESLEGLVVNILDVETGDTTQVIVPNN